MGCSLCGDDYVAASPRFFAVGDSAGYTVCSGFGCTAYTATLEALNPTNGSVEVVAELARDSNNAIDEETMVYVDVNGVEQHASQESFFSGGRTFTTTVPASPGDTIDLTFVSGWPGDEGKQATVSGVVPGGGGGGNGGGQPPSASTGTFVLVGGLIAVGYLLTRE